MATRKGKERCPKCQMYWQEYVARAEGCMYRANFRAAFILDEEEFLDACPCYDTDEKCAAVGGAWPGVLTFVIPVVLAALIM